MAAMGQFLPDHDPAMIDWNAPFPDTRRGGLPPASSIRKTDLGRDERIARTVPSTAIRIRAVERLNST